MSIASLPLAPPEEVGLSTSRLKRLTTILQKDIERGLLPGAVALIARRGRLPYFECLGQRDPASRSPMQRDAIFRIYSMTKPIVSVAAMMLWEEGQFLLGDPIAKYLPEFAAPQVAVERDGTVTLVPAKQPITVQDLLRHTSGLAYEHRGDGPVQRRYLDAKISRRNQTAAEHAATLAGLPLMHQPGTHWEYSRSTDVLGRLVEVLSGQSLGAFFAERIFEPLRMDDTGFHVPERNHGRLAEAFARDPESGAEVQLLAVREKPHFESGGGGLVSTAADYARFLEMMLGQGARGNTRLLGRKTVELMTADHLGPISGAPDLLMPGYGFGLGFAVRRDAGIAPIAGSVGQYHWSGIAGTNFWVDPAEQLFAILMIQAPNQREYYRVLFRDLVYAAIAD